MYITKITTNGYPTCQNVRELINFHTPSQQLTNVYNFKISKEFEKMFNSNSLTTNYELINDYINDKNND
jgi:hypothetical protein